MRFRFTLTHRGSELAPFVIPALSVWDTQIGPNEEWAVGVSTPSVTIVGSGPLSTAESEYLYVDYGFEDGIEYSITVEFTKTYLSGSSNPRAIFLDIVDNDFNVIFTINDTTPGSPGGTDSITINFTGNEDCRKIAIKVLDANHVTFTIDEVTGESFNPGDATIYEVINEPDGWKDAVLRLQRDKDFRSLIEFFDGSFIFYGNNGHVNGGIHFIKALELEFGPDVTIEMLIELAPDDITYEEIFSGQLDLSLAEEMMDNKMRIPIIRDNLWAKFNSRRDTPVDLFATSDLDLRAIATTVDPISLLLPSQIITYYSEYHEPYSITYDASVETWAILNWSREVQSDIKLFTLVRTTVPTETKKILGLFEAPWDGVYTIAIKFHTADYVAPNWESNSLHRIHFRKTNNTAVDTNDDLVVALGDDGVSIETSGSDEWLLFDIAPEFTMFKGEQMSIVLRSISGDATIFGETELIWKIVDLATSGPITLSGEQTIDGTLTAVSDVLVKHQPNPADNGVYESAAGAWTRRGDVNSADELINLAVYVTGGTNQADSSYIQTRETIGTLGVDPIEFEITDNSEERLKAFPGYADEVENFIKITAKTTYPSSQASGGLLIHDAGAAILKSYGLGGDNPFYSEIMGSTLTNARQYDLDGCIWNHAVIRGLQIRGYTISEKPFFNSFNEWWKGVNPIFNLGLSYDSIGGEVIDPVEGIMIEDLIDWDDAAGPFPGSWNYVIFGRPAISINGSGGESGYTRGAMATTGGVPYVITVVLEIFEFGPIDMTFTYALLDASDNELDTVEFTYTTVGFKPETFILTPPSDGTYFGLRAINNTPLDTKTICLRLAVGDSVSQLLLNEEFTDSSIWTNEGSGTDWTIGGGVATVSLTTGSSKALTQEFVGGEVGTYYFLSEVQPTGLGGGDTAQMVMNFYDSGNNLVHTQTYPMPNNDNEPLNAEFNSLVVVTKVEVIFEITAGSNATMTLPYAGLFILVETFPEGVPEEDVIRVEEVEFFYDPDPSVNISNIRNIVRKYDNDKIYNKINIGYNTWKSEEISGIDDPQTQHIYSTRFEKIGQTITLWSEFIAASLAIERTRRERITESKDFKFDDSTFIIALSSDDVSPDVYSVELDEKFTSVENLLDSDTRYNIRLSPSRMLLRWRKWLNGCLQNYTNSFYKFVRGEGNFDMVTTIIPTGCLDEDGEIELSEKQDIEVTDEFIHLPNYYEIEVPMEWEDYKIIRNNRRKAIGISLTDMDHVPLFIDILDYEIMHGRAKIAGWTTEYLELSVVEDQAAMECFVEEAPQEGEICENAITDEFGEPLTDEFGECITFDPNEGGIFDDTFDDTFE